MVLTDDHGTKIAQASLSNDPGCYQEFFNQATEPVKAEVEASRTWGVIYDLLEDLLNIPHTLIMAILSIINCCCESSHR